MWTLWSLWWYLGTSLNRSPHSRRLWCLLPVLRKHRDRHRIQTVRRRDQDPRRSRRGSEESVRGLGRYLFNGLFLSEASVNFSIIFAGTAISRISGGGNGPNLPRDDIDVASRFDGRHLPLQRRHSVLWRWNDVLWRFDHVHVLSVKQANLIRDRSISSRSNNVYDALITFKWRLMWLWHSNDVLRPFDQLMEN